MMGLCVRIDYRTSQHDRDRSKPNNSNHLMKAGIMAVFPQNAAESEFYISKWSLSTLQKRRIPISAEIILVCC
jgi:hypothetical protein